MACLCNLCAVPQTTNILPQQEKNEALFKSERNNGLLLAQRL